MKYENIREEELKNKIEHDYFKEFDCTKIIGNVDFCVCYQEHELSDLKSLLWAEAKKGSSDIYYSIVQLILTIGKARTFDKQLPPDFLGAFDAEKIAFIPYNEIQEIFYQNDFNWNVTPSNYETKEFKWVFDKVKNTIDNKTLLFHYEKDDSELKAFIQNHFIIGKSGLTKTRIDKNNFVIIYNKWLQTVKPTIAVDWIFAKKHGIIDGDFYLADLLSQDNQTLKEKLFVILKYDHYEHDRKFDNMGLFAGRRTEFNDKQVAHTQFWNKYERPPKEDYWDYIINRRDLLVPQDIRERKGSFFTPQIWVELSQKYLADVLGENWQDEYIIWDCAAGTGNLLTGLTNKQNIWASTLDKQDVDVMKDRIDNGANLLKEQVFQFDFLNDDFSKLPEKLQNIINNPKKRKKLVIYINPPYAEATTAKTVTRTGSNKTGVSTNYKVNEYFNTKIGSASNEIFALFMAQIYEKCPDAILAQFSKLKFIQGSNFSKFKTFFLAKYLNGFIVPASTFDNVKSSFPIGFTIWNLRDKQPFKEIKCDVYDKNRKRLETKVFYGDLPQSINKWIKLFENKKIPAIAYMENPGTDFQNNKFLNISNKCGIRHVNYFYFNNLNLFVGVIYFTVRCCIKATWLNDRDQFLYPNDGWNIDKEFQNDCLTYALFHSQNRITSKEGINHWIPFTEQEINIEKSFESHFMSDFIHGRLIIEQPADLYNESTIKTSEKLVFSQESQAVFNAGRELWRYYHTIAYCNINASLYDIREYFQGRNEQGEMNNKSINETYTVLMNELKDSIKQLENKIEPKVYEYGFLKK